MTIDQAEDIAEHPLEETAAWLSDAADDPLAFVEGAFPWGKGELSKFDGPMEWQRWVLEQIRNGLLTSGKRYRSRLLRATVSARPPFVLDRTVGDDDSRGHARDRHRINRVDAHD
jgi:hypothetical protein